MKTQYIITFLILVFAIQSFGQKKKDTDYDKMKAEKVAFITTRIDLSVEEAQQFWPLYNEFDKKINELIEEEHSIHREINQKSETLTDEELETKLDRTITIQQEHANLRLEYHLKFKEILPVKKVVSLYGAEKEFRKDLLHRYRQAPPKQGRGPEPGFDR